MSIIPLRQASWRNPRFVPVSCPSASASSVYRVLKAAGVLDRHNRQPSQKGRGFNQPTAPHRQWHIDIAYLNIGGTFYYMFSVLDGYSRYIVHWEIRQTMTEQEVETILHRAAG